MTYSTCSHQNETFQDSVVLWWIETDKKKKEKKNNWCDSEFDRLISKSSFTCSKLSQLEQILISTWSAYEVNVPKRLHYTMQQAALIQIWVEDVTTGKTIPIHIHAKRGENKSAWTDRVRLAITPPCICLKSTDSRRRCSWRKEAKVEIAAGFKMSLRTINIHSNFLTVSVILCLLLKPIF